MSTLDLISGVMRGDVTEWPASGSVDERAFLDAAVEHRVDALIAWRLRQAGTLAQWPARIRTRLADVARTEALFDSARRTELNALLSAFERAGVGCLLMKGAATAYTSYPQPWLRPRLDADLLIDPRSAADGDRILSEQGYRRENELKGEHVSHQSVWTKVDRLGLRHVIDAHRKISNRPLIADLLSFDELDRRACSVPSISARVPGRVHALLLACLPPATHHHNVENLGWSYDIHLLAERLDSAAFFGFADLARQKQVAAICAAGLTRAVQRFGTAVPAGSMEQLAVPDERSAAYLGASPWRGDIRLSDLRGLDGWRAKIRFVLDVAFPETDFMLKTYNCTSRVIVPALHVHRLVRGTWRLGRRLATKTGSPHSVTGAAS